MSKSSFWSSSFIDRIHVYWKQGQYKKNFWPTACVSCVTRYVVETTWRYVWKDWSQGIYLEDPNPIGFETSKSATWITNELVVNTHMFFWHQNQESSVNPIILCRTVHLSNKWYQSIRMVQWNLCKDHVKCLCKNPGNKVPYHLGFVSKVFLLFLPFVIITLGKQQLFPSNTDCICYHHHSCCCMLHITILTINIWFQHILF